MANGSPKAAMTAATDDEEVADMFSFSHELPDETVVES
jgi:hypothetical protein